MFRFPFIRHFEPHPSCGSDWSTMKTILFAQKLRKFSLCTIFTRIAYHKKYLSSQYHVFLHALLTVYHVVSHVSSSLFLNGYTSLYQFLALISTWKVKIMTFLQYASLISLIYFTLLNTLEIFHAIYFYADVYLALWTMTLNYLNCDQYSRPEVGDDNRP